MTVLQPVKVILTNVPKDFCEELSCNDFPKDPSRGNHKVHLTKEIWVDQNDVMLNNEQFWHRIAPGQTVGLKYAHAITVEKIITDDKGVSVVYAKLHNTEKKKAKAYLHWISETDSVTCEVRIYDHLFSAYNPMKLSNFLDGLNPNSCTTHYSCKMNKNLLSRTFSYWFSNAYLGLKNEDKVQFERLGFFVVDKDTDVDGGRFVWNLTVRLSDKALRQAKSKKPAPKN